MFGRKKEQQAEPTGLQAGVLVASPKRIITGWVIIGITAIAAAALVIIAVVSILIFQDALLPYIPYIIASTVALIGGAGLVKLITGVDDYRLNRRVKIAQTRLIEADASTKEYQRDQEREEADRRRIAKRVVDIKVGTLVYDLHLDRFAYIPASAGERKDLMLMPEGENGAEALGFYQVMTDPKAAYAILGAQRVGKTYVAMHLSDYITSRSLGICSVAGVKAEPGEWPNCKQYVGEGESGRLLHIILAELKRRRERQYRSPVLWVFLDDWINLVATHSKLAEGFFRQAATVMLSAGIVPIFLLQSDTKEDWGVRGGAQLKNNFTKLFIEAPRVNGRLDPTAATGLIQFAGEQDRQPVSLPKGLPSLASRPPALPVITGPARVVEKVVPDIEPDQEAQKVLKVVRRGLENGASFRQMTGYLFDGKFGKPYNDRLIETVRLYDSGLAGRLEALRNG